MATASPFSPHTQHPLRHRSAMRSILALSCLLVMVLPGITLRAWAQPETRQPVVIIPIRGTIGPGLGSFLDRAIDEAEADNASTIILDINTPGGRLDTVLEMRDRILDTPVPVVAFVNREAFSAGALITIASDQIWMTDGAVFGAATPIDGATGETAGEKTISAVRSTFRATAEKQGRDPIIAEAMVDPAVVVDGLDSATSLLTLTTTQARDHGYADGVANDRDALLDALGLGQAPVDVASMSIPERAVSWITDPIVASLLILVGMALIVVDGLIGGFGIVAVAGVGCLALFFWGHYLAGLAGWEDLALIVVGLILIALEAFVIPGFGIAGMLGTVSLIGGLVLAMTRREWGDRGFAGEAGDALLMLLVTLAATAIVIVLGAWALPRLAPSATRPLQRPHRLTLSATVTQGGSGPERPGFLVRLLGGGDTVGRDVVGHTAISRDSDGDPARPRDPASHEPL